MAEHVPVLNDKLGELVTEAREHLRASSSFEDFIQDAQGPSNFNEAVGEMDHPAATLLEESRTQGASLEPPEEPWMEQQKQEALE